jgi:Cof subfamily protein (haloacid dehalogenase superfamily)
MLAFSWGFFLAIRLIATDIDGTLLDSRGQLPESNALAIEEAAERGIEIVIVTGRRFDFARSIANSLPCDLHLISSNGAVIKSKAGETLARRLLPAATARRVLEATPEFRSAAAVLFDRPREKQIVVERADYDDPFRGAYLRRNAEGLAEVAPLVECLNGEDPIEVLFTGECRRMRDVKWALEALSLAKECTLALTEYEHRNLSMLDVLERGVTKGAALADWARRRAILPEEVMAIGDNWNDREMLEFAGMPVVMGNAIPELKSHGWRVTLSNDDGGVASAIRSYALNGDVGRIEKGGMR